MENKILGNFLIYLFISSFSYGQIWDSLGTGVYGDSKHIQVLNNKLYVGGIDTAQGVITFNFSSWDGNFWESIGGGVDGQVYGTVQYNGKIFIGGSFNYAGGPYPFPAPHIYKLTSWDGLQYSNLGYPNGNAINVIDTFNNELYIGTNIVTINNETYKGILKYNDTIYSQVGGGLNGFPRDVLAMTKYDGELIVGGFFSYTGTSLTVNNIAKWNGANWAALGNGLNYGVNAFAVDSINNILYAGGSFDYADTIFVNKIAKWNGTSWQSVGAGLPNSILSLCFYKNHLYAGIGNAFGNYPSSLYKWDGNTWQPIIPAPAGNVYSLKVFQGSLYVAGGFSEIGSVRYSGIARYTDTTTVGLSNELSSSSPNFIIYPNPTKGIITLTLPQPVYERKEISIFNSNGEIVYRRVCDFINGTTEINLPSDIGHGVYICNLTFQEHKFSKRFFIE